MASPKDGIVEAIERAASEASGCSSPVVNAVIVCALWSDPFCEDQEARSIYRTFSGDALLLPFLARIVADYDEEVFQGVSSDDPGEGF